MNASGRSWPSADERLLLHAAIDPEDASALAAWREWRRSNDLDSMGHASFRLMPLIYRRLEGLDDESGDRFVLKNIYRQEWFGNQMLMRRVGGLLTCLHEAGIDTMVLKGAALQALHYGDAGTRPMADVDVLVPTARIHDAIDVLVEHGWQPEYLRPHDRVPVHHSQSFEQAGECAVDLHWHALYQPADERDLWEPAVPLTIGGVDTLSPCATDQLLHVCVHGRPLTDPPSVRWVADAAAVLREPDAVDWDRLVSRARARGVTLQLGDALAYLSSEFSLAVPADVIGSLRAVRVGVSARLAYRLSTSVPAENQVRTSVSLWDRRRRLRAVQPPYEMPRGYGAYLAQHFGFSSRRELVLEQVRRAVGRGRSAQARGYKPA